MQRMRAGACLFFFLATATNSSVVASAEDDERDFPDPGRETQAYDPTCPSGYACVWTLPFYSENRHKIPPSEGGTGGHYFTGPLPIKWSAKNHYNNKAIFLYDGYGGSVCLNAGQVADQSWVGWIAYKVSNSGQTCWVDFGP